MRRDLRRPEVHIALRRAHGQRLQRVYFPLLTALLAAWTLPITVFEAEDPWFRSTATADISGPVVVAVVGGC